MKDDPTLMHHDCLCSVVYLRIHSWWYTFCGFEKMLVTCIYHYNTIESIITALKNLVFTAYLSLHQPPKTTDHFMSPQICLFKSVILLEEYSVQFS